MNKIDFATVDATPEDALWVSYEMVEALCKRQGRTIEDAIAAQESEFVDSLLLDGAALAVDSTTHFDGLTTRKRV